MSGILSSISGKFSQMLILGTVAPVAAFVILFLIFGVPLIPFGFPLLSTLDALDVQGKVIIISLGIMVLSLLLYNLNIPIIRVYEGYPWENWSIGRWRKGIYSSRLRSLVARQAAINILGKMMDAMQQAKKARAAAGVQLNVAQPADPNAPVKPDANAAAPAADPLVTAEKTNPELEQQMSDAAALWRLNDATKNLLADFKADAIDGSWQAVVDALSSARTELVQQINSEYPDDGNILPTRLGNVIRSFEYYPDREYGIDAVTLWPRLVNVLDAGYAGAIDDAKTAFDFMLNSSALSLAMAAILIVLGLGYPIPFSSGARLAPWLLTWLGFIGAAIVFYNVSIERAAAWGEMVKGAFDIYKDPLRKKLGYTVDVHTREEEMKLWDSISREIIYGGWLPAKAPDYSPAAQKLPQAEGDPKDIALEVTRGVEVPAGGGALTVVLSVRNPDKKLAVAHIKLKEQVPDGLDYVWDSAKSNGGAVPVQGSNPYTFEIERIDHEQSVTVRYRAMARHQQAIPGGT